MSTSHVLTTVQPKTSDIEAMYKQREILIKIVEEQKEQLQQQLNTTFLALEDQSKKLQQHDLLSEAKEVEMIQSILENAKSAMSKTLKGIELKIDNLTTKLKELEQFYIETPGGKLREFTIFKDGNLKIKHHSPSTADELFNSLFKYHPNLANTPHLSSFQYNYGYNANFDNRQLTLDIILKLKDKFPKNDTPLGEITYDREKIKDIVVDYLKRSLNDLSSKEEKTSDKAIQNLEKLFELQQKNQVLTFEGQTLRAKILNLLCEGLSTKETPTVIINSGTQMQSSNPTRIYISMDQKIVDKILALAGNILVRSAHSDPENKNIRIYYIPDWASDKSGLGEVLHSYLMSGQYISHLEIDRSTAFLMQMLDNQLKEKSFPPKAKAIVEKWKTEIQFVGARQDMVDVAKSDYYPVEPSEGSEEEKEKRTYESYSTTQLKKK